MLDHTNMLFFESLVSRYGYVFGEREEEEKEEEEKEEVMFITIMVRYLFNIPLLTILNKY